jgi:hypothetical protein
MESSRPALEKLLKLYLKRLGGGQWEAGSMAQVVDQLFSLLKAVGSIPSTKINK